MEKEPEKPTLESLLDDLKEKYEEEVIDSFREEGKVLIDDDGKKVESIENAKYFVKISKSLSNRPIPQKINVVDEFPDGPDHGDIVIKREDSETYTYVGNKFVSTGSIDEI